MSSGMSTYQLECLFIEKLSEKYDMTERSIKKAFSRFDSDGNGLLNLNELVSGFEIFLNGVSRKEVEALVKTYDVNGDGMISFEEFYEFLTMSKSKPKKKNMGRSDGNGPPQQRERREGSRREQPSRKYQSNYDEYEYDPSEQSVPDDISDMPEEYSEIESESLYSNSQQDEAQSELSSIFDPTIGNAVESRVKVFTEALKNCLYQEAMRMRRDNKIANSHQVSFKNLSESVSRNLLERAFQRESNRAGGRDDNLINLKSFCK